eukprot:3481357-Heterocapsa_arctica.AAC.1
MSQNTSYRSARIRRKEWLWDEYDEIWGFDNVLEGLPDYQLRVEALRDRSERGIPTLLSESVYGAFYGRMERRRENRMRRGVPP